MAVGNSWAIKPGHLKAARQMPLRSRRSRSPRAPRAARSGDRTSASFINPAPKKSSVPRKANFPKSRRGHRNSIARGKRDRAPAKVVPNVRDQASSRAAEAALPLQVALILNQSLDVPADRAPARHSVENHPRNPAPLAAATKHLAPSPSDAPASL